MKLLILSVFVEFMPIYFLFYQKRVDAVVWAKYQKEHQIGAVLYRNPILELFDENYEFLHFSNLPVRKIGREYSEITSANR